jgi:hypothetical protein
MVIFLAEAAPLSLLQITDEERVSYHDDEVRTSAAICFSCVMLLMLVAIVVIVMRSGSD